MSVMNLASPELTRLLLPELSLQLPSSSADIRLVVSRFLQTLLRGGFLLTLCVCVCVHACRCARTKK